MFCFPAINPIEDPIIAATGAGGKTSCLEYLALQLKELGHRVLLTTTTKIFHPAGTRFEQHIDRLIDSNVSAAVRVKPATATITVAGYQGEDPAKLYGLSPDLFSALIDEGIYDNILVEADGSKRLPLKAPADREPVLPDHCQVVIAVTGWMGVNSPVDAGRIHRWQPFSRITGLSEGDEFTPLAMHRLLCASNGLFKQVPDTARKIWLMNQVDTPLEKAQATEFIQAVMTYSTPAQHCLMSSFKDRSPLFIQEVN